MKLELENSPYSGYSVNMYRLNLDNNTSYLISEETFRVIKKLLTLKTIEYVRKIFVIFNTIISLGFPRESSIVYTANKVGHIEMKLTNGNSYFYFILHGYCPFILRNIDEVIELKKLIDEVLK